MLPRARACTRLAARAGCAPCGPPCPALDPPVKRVVMFGFMSEPTTTDVATGLQFPEGPVAMPDGTVLCVELKRGTVDRVHPDGTVEVVASPGGSPNGLAIGPDGAVYVCNSGGWDFHDVM